MNVLSFPLTGLLGLSMLAVSALSASNLPDYKPDANTPRTSIPEIYKWDLDALFPSDDAFEKARVALLAEAPTLSKFQGKLADPASLLACIDLYTRLQVSANRLTLYANMRQTTAASDDQAGAMGQTSIAALDEVMRQASFLRRELIALPQAVIDKAFAQLPALKPYRGYIENIRRRGARLLSADAEKALALLGDNLWAEIDLNELPSGYEDAHGALLGNIAWPKIKDAQGNDVQLTLSNYGRFRASSDPRVRLDAVNGMMGALRQFQNTLAATYAGQVKLDVAYARARGYDTALEAYMDKDNVPVAVYENLVRTINANTTLLHRYVSLRKKALGLSEVHLCDLYIPIVKGVEKDIPFSEARRIIPEALKPLGADYAKVLNLGLDPRNGWMDLYPHKDKRSGAYSSSVYGIHPYVMMNYQDSLDDMSTLAHEFGHALHSHIAMQNQSAPDYRYTMLLAEIASTCNETLLSDYLIARSTDRAEKAYLLTEQLETIRTTIFRQTMFAEFELRIHRLHESGTPITATLLEETYRNLLKTYYGPDYTIGTDDGMEWAYIGHFYYKYYVYSYAAGLSSGIALAERIRTLGEPASKAYLGMLAGGCSRPSLDLLKDAGVDLTKPDAIEAAMKHFAKTLDEVEKLLATPAAPAK